MRGRMPPRSRSRSPSNSSPKARAVLAGPTTRNWSSRRSGGSRHPLTDATDAELAAYAGGELAPEQLRGAASNVKGILHEMLVARAENLDGDTADGGALRGHQSSGRGHRVPHRRERDPGGAAQGGPGPRRDPRALLALSGCRRHGDLGNLCRDGRATSAGPWLLDSGIGNAEITELTKETLAQGFRWREVSGHLVQDGMVTSVLLGGALQAKAVLQGRTIDARQIRFVDS